MSAPRKAFTLRKLDINVIKNTPPAGDSNNNAKNVIKYSGYGINEYPRKNTNKRSSLNLKKR